MSRYIDADSIQYDEDIPGVFIASKTRINNIPTADVRENVRGEWIYNHDETGFYKCSACGCSVLACSKYCPDCGADMRGNNHD